MQDANKTENTAKSFRVVETMHMPAFGGHRCYAIEYNSQGDQWGLACDDYGRIYYPTKELAEQAMEKLAEQGMVALISRSGQR